MARGYALAPQVKEEILAMDDEGLKPADIAKELDIRPTTIYRVLQEAGRGKTDGFNSDRQFTGQEIVTAISMYQERASVTDICEKVGMTPTKLYAILREAGIPTRTQVENETREQREMDALTMYRAGKPYYEIVEATGLSTFTINKLLHAAGEPLRRPRKMYGR